MRIAVAALFRTSDTVIVIISMNAIITTGDKPLAIESRPSTSKVAVPVVSKAAPTGIIAPNKMTTDQSTPL